MKNKFNLLLLEYAIASIFRRGMKNLFIFFVFTLLIFLLSSILFISNSIQKELDLSLDSSPDYNVPRKNNHLIKYFYSKRYNNKGTKKKQFLDNASLALSKNNVITYFTCFYFMGIPLKLFCLNLVFV